MSTTAIIFRLLNLITSFVIVLGGVLLFVRNGSSWNSCILGVIVAIGSLCLSWRWFNIVVGCIIMAVGLFYIAMHFVGVTPSPSMSAVPSTSTNLNAGQAPGSYTNPTPAQPNNYNQPADLQPNMIETHPNQDSYQNQGSYQTQNS
ncbi:hypothetical protein FBU30_002362 [Linnemannia zychae]|nr:hypothetical protein FBU30_002362 [Linnemannia zychae]